MAAVDVNITLYDMVAASPDIVIRALPAAPTAPLVDLFIYVTPATKTDIIIGSVVTPRAEVAGPVLAATLIPIFLYVGDATPENIIIGDPTVVRPTGGFPTQFSGFKVRKTGSTIELCLVATADAPAGMGGQLRVRKGGTTYALYLVETTDPNASPVRIKTTTGTKSIRLKT